MRANAACTAHAQARAGALKLMWALQQEMGEIAASTQSAEEERGLAGELAGVPHAPTTGPRRHRTRSDHRHRARHNPRRDEGRYEVVKVERDERGGVDVAGPARKAGDDVAC